MQRLKGRDDEGSSVGSRSSGDEGPRRREDSPVLIMTKRVGGWWYWAALEGV